MTADQSRAPDDALQPHGSPPKQPGSDVIGSLSRHGFDRSRQMASQVFEKLRELIISLALAPGTVLSRVTLAKQFGLSSTPIREALLKLEEEGLVEVFPQHATVVSPIDLALARQAQFLRRSIELEVVRSLAEKPDEALLRRLEAILSRQHALSESDDFAELAVLDEAFHRELYAAAGVPDLWPLVRRQSGHLDRLRRLHLPIAGKAPAILRDHRSIVRAIADGKPEIAQSKLRKHLSGTIANVDEIRARFPDYVRG